MPSLLPRPARGFYRCQTWGTKGSAQIRHLHTRHQGVMSRKKTDEAELFGAGTVEGTVVTKAMTSLLADQNLSDLWSTQLSFVFLS